MEDATPPDRAEIALARAVEAEEAGDIDAAESAYREAAASCSDAAYRLGLFLSEWEDYPGAASAYEQASAAGDLEATLMLANLLATVLERPDDAKALYGSLIDQGMVRAMFALGYMLWSESDWSGARAAFERAISAGEPRGHLEFGFLLADDERDGEGALAAFERAAAEGVEEAGTQVGWQLARLGRVDEAEPVLRRAYEAGDLVAGDVLRDVLVALDRSEEADALNLELTKRAREEVSLEYRDLLAMLDGEGLNEDALAAWVEEESHDRTPLELAALMFDSARLAQAETTLKLAIEDGWTDPVDVLADLYEKTGRSAQAEKLKRSHCVEGGSQSDSSRMHRPPSRLRTVS